jgi:hypothetical protein
MPDFEESCAATYSRCESTDSSIVDTVRPGFLRWWRVAAHHISIDCGGVIIICIDVTRARSGEIGKNLLTRHFLASLHACDTIEGLMLAYYDWLFDLRTFIQVSV